MISLFLPQSSPSPSLTLRVGFTWKIQHTLKEEQNKPGATAPLIRCLPHKPKDLSSVASAHIKLDCGSTHLLSHCWGSRGNQQPGTHWPARLIREPQVPESDIVTKYKVVSPEATTPKIDFWSLQAHTYMYMHTPHRNIRTHIQTHTKEQSIPLVGIPEHLSAQRSFPLS